jgi:hypothetical protein
VTVTFCKNNTQFDKKPLLYKKTVVKFLINNFNGVRFKLSKCRGRIAYEEMNEKERRILKQMSKNLRFHFIPSFIFIS